MNFVAPEYGLFILVAFAVLLKFNTKVVHFLRIKDNRRFFWMGLSFFTLILALMQPQIAREHLNTKNFSKEIIIAVDVSYSMQARDLKPTRFEAAKVALKQIIALAPENRYAIVAFTTNAIPLTPPTSDSDILSRVLDSLDVGNIITKGTSLLPVLSLSSKLLHGAEGEVILLSDGGDEKIFNTLYTYAKEKKLHLSMVALASNSGAQLLDEYGAILKDKNNNMVITAFNRNIEALITQTDGKLVAYDDVESLETILHRDKALTLQKTQTQQEPLFAYFLFFTMLFFSFAYSRIKYITPLLLLFVEPQPLEAGVFEYYYEYQARSAYGQGEYEKASLYYEKLAITNTSYTVAYNLANAYYNSGRFIQAKVLYSAIKSSDPEFKKDIYYNLANSYVKLEAYEKADKNYLKSLLLGYEKDADKNRQFAQTLKKQLVMNFDKKEKHKKRSKQNKSSEPKKKEVKSNQKSGDGKDKGGTDTKKSSAQKEASKVLKKAKSKRPLSYSQYQLINQGASHEKTPW
jgi:Ca-activated chloride channel homolog